MGTVEYWSLRHDTDRTPLEPLVAEAFRLEHMGWKGQDQTSVRSQPGMSSFFERQLRLLHATGMADLQFLKLDGAPIAFEIGYLSKGVYYSHKIGFDPTHRSVGPGQLLTCLQFERWFRLKECNRIDSMGILNDATTAWTTSVHQRGRLIVTSGTWRGKIMIRMYELAKRLYRTIRSRNGAPARSSVDSSPRREPASESAIPVSANG
jgi:hypothetical protein